ncbi:MAG: acyltransferase [Cyanobacteria bacterium J06623_7]
MSDQVFSGELNFIRDRHSSSQQQSRVYFPGLNSLRAIAALLVIVCHIEQLKTIYGYDNIFDNMFINQSGVFSVTFFFCLSGFLITYLLLVERERTQTIDIKKFYVRRVLRIWPLYYFLGLLCLVFLPHLESLQVPIWQKGLETNYWAHVFSYITFLPNLAIAFIGMIPHANQVWSIGVEEQFYLIWPLLFRYTRNIWQATLGVIGIYLTVKLATVLLIAGYGGNPGIVNQLERFYRLLQINRIDCMAIGAIGAGILYYDRQRLRPVYTSWAQYMLYTAAGLFVIWGGFRGGWLEPLNQEIFAVMSALMILNVATNPQTIVKLQNRALDYLGRISYGIYMFHCLCIAIAYLVEEWTNLSPSMLIANVIVYPFVFGLTILLATISYRWLEKPFMKQKHRFTTVPSGDRPA